MAKDLPARWLKPSAEFVALATPAQLARVLDVDLWRARTPGTEERFDPDRFGVWLAVLLEAGPDVAADKLAALDLDLVAAGFAQHLAVFTVVSATPYMTLDGEQMQAPMSHRTRSAEIGGYAIETRRTSQWDVIVELLAFLSAEREEFFHRLMQACVRLSNGAREADASHDLLEDAEQHLFDLAADREQRREQQGYVTAAQAHAFLRAARDLGLDGDRPPASPIARAYFRDFEPTEPRARALPGAVDPHAGTEWTSVQQLAFLANVIVAGSSVQGRAFSGREAGDAVLATCNLGLENWPAHWPDRDLVTAFQAGWSILHRDVCIHTAKQLIAVLGEIRCRDRDTWLRLESLRRDLIRHTSDGEPWRARDALDAILLLDAPAWAALLGLIDQCPVLHAALGASERRSKTIDPAAYAFISRTNDIASVRAFLATLPTVLSETP